MGSRFSCVPKGLKRFSLDRPWDFKNTVWECVEFVISCRCKVKVVWLYNLKLQEKMRNFPYGDQQILLVVAWLVLRRFEIEEIGYWQKVSCVSWPSFQGGGRRWRRVWDCWNCNVLLFEVTIKRRNSLQVILLKL